MRIFHAFLAVYRGLPIAYGRWRPAMLTNDQLSDCMGQVSALRPASSYGLAAESICVRFSRVFWHRNQIGVGGNKKGLAGRVTGKALMVWRL